MPAIRIAACLAALMTIPVATRPASAQPGDAQNVDFVVLNVEGEIQSLGEYWIGVACDEIGDDLRAHIDLPEGQGVMVKNVFPDSAAAKAGFKNYDIVLSAGEEKLKSPYDLVKAVQKAKDKEIRFEVLRKGRKSTIKVTPQKRPGEHRLAIRTADKLFPGKSGKVEAERRKLMEQLMKQQKDLRVLFLEPGQVVPNEWTRSIATALPSGVSVSITKTNNEPVKIAVRRGDKKWDITENELDKLPEDIREGIKGMLNKDAGKAIRLRLNKIPQVIDGPVQVQPGRRIQIARPNIVTRVETETDIDVKELAKEIRRLAEKIERLEKQQKD
ncbi:MAG: PDZ domain-containing protein [Planctomycetes bacterium]|nr:PDZ domain-containing protein [Planctomycetota bacterium]